MRLENDNQIKKTPTANHVMDKRLIRCLVCNASVAQLVEQLKKEVSCIDTCSSDTDVPLVQIQPEAIYVESGQEVKSRAIYASRFGRIQQMYKASSYTSVRIRPLRTNHPSCATFTAFLVWVLKFVALFLSQKEARAWVLWTTSSRN